MMKDVEKAAERRIAGVVQPLPGIFGDVNGKRAIRAEQAEQSSLKTRRTGLRSVERGERGRRKRQIRVLSQSNGFIDRPQRATPPWLLGVQALQSSQGLIEIVPVRRLRQSGQEVYSVGLVPHCGTHRLISPLVSERRTVSVNELIET